MEFISWFLADLKQHKDAFQSVYYFAVACLGLIGIYFLRQRDRAMQRSSEAAKRQTEIAEESQINDQYIKSIEQLANENLTIKLGGIYGLENVAKSSTKFYMQVIEVLTAYIRESAIAPDGDIEDHMPKPEIQTILTVLGRVKNEGVVNFDLTECFLRSYIFQGDFRSCICINADLSDSSLKSANFSNSSCEGAKFDGCDCTSTDFSHASLLYSSFKQAKCLKTNFDNSYMHRTSFKDANVLKTNLTSIQKENIIQ